MSPTLFCVLVLFVTIVATACIFHAGEKEGKEPKKGEIPQGLYLGAGFLVVLICEISCFCFSISSVGGPFWLSGSKAYRVISEVPVEGGFIATLEDPTSHLYYSVFVGKKLPKGTAFTRRDVGGLDLVPVDPYSIPPTNESANEFEKVSEKPEE